MTWAEQRVPSGLAALIVASVPIWMTVLDGLQRRERPHGVVVLGLAMGLAGIAFLVAPGRFAGGEPRGPARGRGAPDGRAALGDRLALLRGASRCPSSTLLATAMEMIAGGLILLLVAGLTREWQGFSLAAVSSRSWLALGYLIVAGSLLGFSAYIFLLGATTPARVSTYAYVNPLVAVFLGWLLAGEAVTLRTVLAAAVIVAAVALIIRHGARRTRRAGRGERRAARGAGRSPMNEVALLLRLLDESYEKNAWQGPNLQGSLRGVTAGQAAWRPRPAGTTSGSSCCTRPTGSTRCGGC